MHMQHMRIDRRSVWEVKMEAVMDEIGRYKKSPGGTVPPGGRCLALCFTWRQAASNDHDSQIVPEG